MQHTREYLIGCDWGTSSFRLRLINCLEENVLAEVTSNEGILKMHQHWQEQYQQINAKNKVEFFQKYLLNQLTILTEKAGINLSGTTILISGMASSSIGMEEVPYAKIPFALDGSNASIKHLIQSENFPHDIFLIAGVRTENDVMRGEETQLLGLMKLLKEAGTNLAEGILIFPGTHSKHVYFKMNQISEFNTFMTGELFNLTSAYSILKDSIDYPNNNTLTKANADAFRKGVQKSKKAAILNGLFTVRTNQLFNKLNKDENFYYLSGLLIGEELKYLVSDKIIALILCSSSNLYNFYCLAITELGLAERTTFIPASIIDQSAIAGQLLLFDIAQKRTENE